MSMMVILILGENVFYRTKGSSRG